MIKTDIGEYIVGAYLKVIKKCDIIDYNARPPGGGLEGLNELDVVGLDFKNKSVYLCEVTTHIRGILYKDNKTTIVTIKKKYEKQKEYASKKVFYVLVTSSSKRIFNRGTGKDRWTGSCN